MYECRYTQPITNTNYIGGMASLVAVSRLLKFSKIFERNLNESKDFTFVQR